MRINRKSVINTVLGSAILAFGMYNVHAVSGITEGGVLGLSLLLKQLFDLSPAWTEALMTAACYLLGYKTFGRRFILLSAVACLSFSGAYAVCECFPPVYPAIANMPLAAAVIGAVFVSVGVGLCVRAGGAPSGDDALAMSLSARWHVRIQTVYLASDLIVLMLSLVYMPLKQFIYSLVTVTLSGQIIGWIDTKKE